RVDRGVVDEDVGAAALLGDESEALFGVEPLHGSGSHKPSLGPKGCPAPEPASVKTRMPHNCIRLRTTRARGHMLRRLCTARETKLQLATSLARGRPSAIEVKITSPECLNAPSGTPVTPPGGPSAEPFPPGSSGDGRGGRSARHGRGLASRCGQSSHPAA